MRCDVDLGTLQGCVSERWSPGLGDPGLWAWLTVAAYVLCLALSLRVWRRAKGQPGRAFWMVLAVILAILAVNKQLDLQSALTAAGKCLARAQGWYGQRRPVQMAFVAAVAGIALIAVTVMMFSLRRRNLVAALGVTILLAFVVVRAASFHHIDRLIGQTGLGLPNNVLFENAGLVLIAANALWLSRRLRPAA